MPNAMQLHVQLSRMPARQHSSAQRSFSVALAQPAGPSWQLERGRASGKRQAASLVVVVAAVYLHIKNGIIFLNNGKRNDAMDATCLHCFCAICENPFSISFVLQRITNGKDWTTIVSRQQRKTNRKRDRQAMKLIRINYMPVDQQYKKMTMGKQSRP